MEGNLDVCSGCLSNDLRVCRSDARVVRHCRSAAAGWTASGDHDRGGFAPIHPSMCAPRERATSLLRHQLDVRAPREALIEGHHREGARFA